MKWGGYVKLPEEVEDKVLYICFFGLAAILIAVILCGTLM